MGAQGRLITRHHGLWFALLPTVLRELNAHRGVDVAVLIDEAWSKALGSSSSKLSELDIMRAFLPHLKHPMELSLAAPLVTEDVLLRFEVRTVVQLLPRVCGVLYQFLRRLFRRVQGMYLSMWLLALLQPSYACSEKT